MNKSSCIHCIQLKCTGNIASRGLSQLPSIAMGVVYLNTIQCLGRKTYDNLQDGYVMLKGFTQLVNKLLTFYKNQRFITMSTRACHFSLSWARCIKSTLFHPISLTSILILSSYLCLCLPSPPFKFSSQKNVCICHTSHACYMPHPSLSPCFDHPNNIWWRIQVMQSSSASCTQTSLIYSFIYFIF